MLDINQNGVGPGSRKLIQFKQALIRTGCPKLYSQDGKGLDAKVYVKIFDPCGSWTWFITEWDGNNECFGMVDGDEKELGYMNLEELASVEGQLGIGLEIDVWFEPQTITSALKGNRIPNVFPKVIC